MVGAEDKFYDVIVAGVGSMGAAACYHLARRGLRVLGLEQFQVPHQRGSHHGHSRMIRQSYFEHPDYVPLLKRAYELWETLEAESEREIFHQTGGLYLGPPGAEIVKGSLAAAREHGLPHEQLDHAALRERFPEFRLPDEFVGFYEARAGLLIPENAIAAHAEAARNLGADLRERTALGDWSADANGVTVSTERETFRADHLVITAGAWSGRVLKSLGIKLQVTRQVMAWFAPRNPEPFQHGQFPCWFLESDSPFGHYGFPMLDSGQPGFKVALHQPGEPIDPDRLPDHTGPSAEEIQGLHSFLETYLPDAAGPLLASAQCLYTNSPDSHFVIDRHPEQRNVSLACGFSGHGFKFASVVGEILADLASHGHTEPPARFLGLKRFG